VTEGRDRAQLILIGALALAVSLVVIALVLNSAIYTHNLASRYQSPAESPSTFARDVHRGVGAGMDHTNRDHGDSGFGTVEDEFEHTLSDHENASGRYAAANGRSVSIDRVPDSTVEGIRIVDDETGGSTFQPAAGPEDEWMVASQVRVRQFDVRAERSSLDDLNESQAETVLATPDLTTTTETPFVVNVTNGTTEWRVSVYDDTVQSDRVNVTVHEFGTTTVETCSVTNDNVTVEFGAAEVNDLDCEPLEFMAGFVGPYNVTYYYGDNAVGEYEITADWVIDGPSSEAGPFTDAVDTVNYGDHCSSRTYNRSTSSNYPRVSPAIYDSTVVTNFTGPDTSHDTVRRIAPEEPGPAPVSPRILGVTVTDNDNTSADFTVDVDVEDPDGDLERVEGELVGISASYTDTSVGGSSGTGSLSLSDSTDGTFTVRLTVVDTAGNSRTVEQSHESDGGTSGCPE
jgi:hypothetical protein